MDNPDKVLSRFPSPMSVSVSCKSAGASCRGPCNPYLCTAPPPVLSLNWADAAFQATQGSVVGVSNIPGSVAGSGFWVTARAVVTSWALVAKQSLGLHVTVFQAGGGPPLVLDAVLVFAIPTLDLAFLTVNPLTVGGMLVAPPLLKVALDAATGQSVFTLSNAGGVDGNSLATGVIRALSYVPTGTLTDVCTSVPFLGDSSLGSPILRATDLSIVGIVQYAAPAVSSTVTTRVAPAAGAPCAAGLAALALNTAIGWALSESAVLSANYVLGAAASVTIRRGLALGQRIESEAPVAPGVQVPSVYAPLPASGSALNALELGVPATGATLGSVVASAGTAVATPSGSNFSLTLHGNQTLVPAFGTTPSPLPDVVLDAGYTRQSMPAVWRDISTSGTLVTFDSDTGIMDLTSILASNAVRIAGAPAPGNTISSLAAAKTFVSALGMVLFYPLGTTSSGVSLSEAYVAALIEAPAPTLEATFAVGDSVYFAAPFASTAFVRGASSSFPLTAWYSLDTTTVPSAPTLTVQWRGVSNSTGVPVNFQVVLGVGTASTVGSSDLWVGNVTFAYAPDMMVPGWADTEWLTGTAMTAPPTASAAVVPQVIRVPTVPVGGDAIYFGIASAESTIVVSRTSPGGSLPPYIVSAHGEVGPNPMPAALVGTVVAANRSATIAPFFQYALFQGAPAPSLGTLVTVNGLGIGLQALNQTSLGDVLIQSGGAGTDLGPVPVATTWRQVSFGANQVLTPQQTALLLASGRTLGMVGAGTGPLTVNTFQFFPGTPANSFGGVALVLPSDTLPGAGGAEPLQPELRSVQGSVLFDVSSLTSASAFSLSLGNTDSTYLSDGFVPSGALVANPTGSTLVVVVYPIDGALQYQALYRYGYANTGSTYTFILPTPVPSSNYITVPFTLTYPATTYSPRINTLIVGRPPVAGFANPVGAQSPQMAAEVTLTECQVAYRTIATQPGVGSFAVVNGPRNVARPDFANNSW